jgi:HEAT repeat protein
MALLLGACAGGSGASDGGTRSTGGGDSTVASFEQDTQKFMEDGLHQFSDRDPAWPQTRARWLALGERESTFLVTTMFAALLRAQKLSAPDLVERARHELVLIGAPAVPFLGEVLTAGHAYTVYDAVEEVDKDVSVDDSARTEAADILALIGSPAAPELARAAQGAETKSGRSCALKALGNMGERGAATAADTLVGWASNPDWVLRVEAIHGLRGFSDARTRQTLIAALADSESLVREKAADALVVRRETGAVAALRRASSNARSAGRLLEARHFDTAARRIETGR